VWALVLRWFVFSILLIGCVASTALAEQRGTFEFNGTVVKQAHGSVTIVDTECHYYIASAYFERVLVDGRPMRDYLKLPFNAHVVILSDGNLTQLVSLAHRPSGAPKNCSVYSAIRTVDGFLTLISQGNAVGGITIETDTGASEDFWYESGTPQRKIRFNGRPFEGCWDWPSDPCIAMPDLRPRMRVRVHYHVEMVDGKRRVRLLSIDSIQAK
jgi:hypothetical protein